MGTLDSLFSSSSLLLLLLFLVFFVSRTVYGNAELRALMDIKSSLDPENKILSSWTADGDPCGGTFLGVVCNQHHKVANISLQSKNLAGKLPPALIELKCLSGLYLHYNSLTGEIPKEITNLTELTDLYLNNNGLSGSVPPELGNMASLRALDLCCNQLTGSIPTELGSMRKLSVLSLQNNRLTGPIPLSLGNLATLSRLFLSSNKLIGPITVRLANLPKLEVLDVQNNTLSGVVPPAFKKLNEGFNYSNNPGLCGSGFTSLRVCTVWDNINIDQGNPLVPTVSNTAPKIPESAHVQVHCNHTRCSSSSKLPRIAVVTGITTLTMTLIIAGFLGIFFRHRRRKQRIGNTSEISDDRSSNIEQMTKESYRSPSPLVSLEYSKGWDQMISEQSYCHGICSGTQQGFKYNLEEVESATHHFSEVNLLGKSNISSVYKGILKDGSLVAIRRINVTSCKSEETEFMNGLNLLTSLNHDNLVSLRGFCCSKGRGECFLIYDFASKGSLSQYLDVENGGSSHILDWPSRVSIINGIAKGIGYLHSNEPNKPPMVHQNLSVEQVLVDEQFNPLISGCGLLKLLADDVVYSAVKVSAAFGYMAPEYVTTGRFTEKSDVYAFGVIILQILSGKRKLTNSMLLEAESCKFEDFVDPNLKGNYSEHEATKLTKIALDCTHEIPDNRPTMASVLEELNRSNDG